MLSSLQKVVARPSVRMAAVRALSTVAPSPSVKDLVINLTFVDPSGARRKVTGLVGKVPILESSIEHGVAHSHAPAQHPHREDAL